MTYDKIEKLGPPDDDKIDNPFFAYGIFKPGQLGFAQIKNLKPKYSKTITIPYKMYYRDGIPLILDKPHPSSETAGNLIYFNDNTIEVEIKENGVKKTEKWGAYDIIGNAEPSKLYEWGEIKIGDDPVNVLFGIDPKNGSFKDDYDCSSYDFRNDSYFTVAMDMVKKFIAEDIIIGYDDEEFFEYQMHYILLWSIIERYGSLKYGKESISKNNNKIAKTKTFKHELENRVKRKDTVYSSKDHQEWKLDPHNRRTSMKYYYTIRSNIVHRGKSVTEDDRNKIKYSLNELYDIFRAVLDEDINGKNLK